jgi:hypothetical protein
MNMIMVQVADKKWTTEALHLACAMARNSNMAITLVRFMEVGHMSYLGTDLGRIAPTPQEYRELQDYSAAAAEYGIELDVTSIQCLSRLDVVAQAAEELAAEVVFARLPETSIPYWHKFQLWNLKRQLQGQHCQLFTLDQPENVEAWVPAVTVKAGVSGKS